MQWSIRFTRRVEKNISGLPDGARTALMILFAEMRQSGPVRGDWPNYGKLGKNLHHCHLKKGRPTCVVVWMERSKGEIEVKYVGTHEDAPY